MERQRLTGVDLVRGLAIYGVVILHTDEGVRVLPDSWMTIRQIAAFAVPFFLATSFYLAAGKLYTAQKPYPLQVRFVRLLIPYGFWSLFYLLYRSLKYLAVHDLDRVKQLFQDPVSILFFGGAAFHLYFLPLLFAGTVLMKLAEFLISKRVSSKLLVIFIVISLFFYQVVIVTGNTFENASGIAFQSLFRLVFSSEEQNPILRVLLVELAWMIRCLPYVLIAVTLNHPSIASRLQKLLSHSLAVCLAAFLAVNLFGHLLLPGSIHDVARGYTALFFAIALSNHLKENSLLKSLGLYSFGIYLIHLLFVEISQSIMIRMDPAYIDHVSTVTLLMISIAIFLISWGATALLIRNKQLSRVLV